MNICSLIIHAENSDSLVLASVESTFLICDFPAGGPIVDSLYSAVCGLNLSFVGFHS